MVDFRCKVVALLVWFLSRDVRLAAYYVLCTGKSPLEPDMTIPLEWSWGLLFLAWLREEAVTTALQHSIQDLNEKKRCIADQFLVRSLIAEYILERNGVGETVPTQEAVQRYLRYWSYRPVPHRIQRRLVRLTTSRNSKRKFGVLMRQEWLLQCRSLQIDRGLARSEIEVVASFYRFSVENSSASICFLSLDLLHIIDCGFFPSEAGGQEICRVMNIFDGEPYRRHPFSCVGSGLYLRS